jgi:hypothetical protein
MCLFEREKQSYSLKEARMTSIADGTVIIQTSAESIPSTPSWFGARRAAGCASSQARRPEQDQ